MKLIRDPSDQTLPLHYGSWRPAHFRAGFQRTASSLRRKLPEGRIGKLWAQGLRPHQSEQDLSLDPSPSSANSSLFLYVEPRHSHRYNLQAYKSQFQTLNCTKKQPSRLPTQFCPKPILYGLDFLMSKIRLLYLPLTIFVCYFWLSLLLFPWYTVLERPPYSSPWA